MSFPAFLELMPASFPELSYTRETHYYARFRLRNQNADDPQPLVYPIIAREEGTIVGYEQIEGLLNYFSLSVQKFRDGYNALYELTPLDSQPKKEG